MEELVSIEKAAQLFGSTVYATRKAIKEGKVRATKEKKGAVGREKMRVSVKEIQRVLDLNKEK